jgi:regulatory protein
MRVAQVRTWPRDPSVVVVQVEGAGTYRVGTDTASRLGLHEGAEIDARVLAQLIDAAEIRRGRLTSLRLLQRRLRSRTELDLAMRRRGLTRLQVAAVLADLERAGWIDDARFARLWIEERMALRPRGARALRAELRARGLAPDVIDAALRGLISVEQERDAALAQAARRLDRLRGLPPAVVRRRLVAWLQRRGFGQAAIACAVRALLGVRPEGSNAGPAA